METLHRTLIMMGRLLRGNTLEVMNILISLVPTDPFVLLDLHHLGLTGQAMLPDILLLCLLDLFRTAVGR